MQPSNDVSRDTDDPVTADEAPFSNGWTRLLGLAPALLLIGAVALGILIDRGSVLRAAADRSLELSEVAKVHADELLAAVEQVMATEAAAYRARPDAAPDFAVPTRLGVVALAFVDADGRIVATAGGDPAALRLIGNAEMAATISEAGSARLQISIIQKAGRIEEGGGIEEGGSGFLLLTRRLGGEGRAQGSVVALLSGNALLTSLASLPLDPGTRVSIRAADGQVAASLPLTELRVAPDAGFLRIRAPSTIRSPGDGVWRIVTAQRIAGGAFRLTVGLDLADVLHDWEIRSLWLASLGMLTAIGLGWLLRRMLSAQRATWRANGDQTRRLKLLADAISRLGASSDPALLAARLAELTRALIPCRDVHVTLAPRTAGASPAEAVASGPGAASRSAVTRAPKVAMLARMTAHDGRDLGAIAVHRDAAGDDTLDAATLTQLAHIAGVELETRDLAAAAAEATARAERNLRVAEAARQEVEQILASISDGVVLVDDDLRLLFANEKAKRFLGGASADWLGKTVGELEAATAADGNGLATCLRQAVRNRVRLDAKACPMPSGGWSDVTIYPHPRGLAVYMRDVTQEISLETRLRQTVEMEALGRLAGGVAHDFNNRLTVISGCLELFESETQPDTAEHEAARMALRAVADTREVTQRLLRFSRGAAPALTAVATADALAGNSRVIRRTLVNLDILLDVEPGIWPILVDPEQFETAILNLAITAGNAMPEGGLLRIEASNLALTGAPHRSRSDIADGDYVEIVFTDRGAGIAPDILPSVFEPFLSTSFLGQGVGLGLAMVRDFARQAGGAVRIDSTPDAGTKVSLHLPRAPATDAAREYAPPSHEVAAASSGGIVLVVEDDPMLRTNFGMMLMDLGYSVHTAGSAEQALALIGDGMAPDLLLTDVTLGGAMSGVGLARAARQLLPELPVIFVSGYPDPEVAAFEPGAVLLEKPFRRAELAALVRDRIRGAVVAA